MAFDSASTQALSLSGVVDDPEFWSSILLSAVEQGEHARVKILWKHLKLAGKPAAQDYVCKARAASALHDWEGSLRIVKNMHEQGLPMDSAACNLALGACVAAGKIKEGILILDLMEQDDSRNNKDVAAYNALMKGLATNNDLDGALKLQARMQDRGVEPTQVTFGILLDACVNQGDLEKAGAVFQDMITRGCPMNTVLYTTLIKGLARAGRVDKAMEVYEHMVEEGTTKPDTIMFSVLIKANCDTGRMEEALHLLDSMIALGYRPDEIVFNNLLVGCGRDSNLRLGHKLLDDMKRLGVQPSHATASILIKLYAKCHVLDDAQHLLTHMPEELGLEAEPRLYAQLVHASVRDRQGRRAVEVYKMLIRICKPDPATNSNILNTCLNFNMLDTAVELHNAAIQAGCEISEKDRRELQQGLDRKTWQQTMSSATGRQTGKDKRSSRCYCGV